MLRSDSSRRYYEIVPSSINWSTIASLMVQKNSLPMTSHAWK
jgi:hypothetical protein